MPFIVCIQLNGFKYSRWLNSLILPIDGALTGTTTPGQSEPGSNGNKGVLYILESSRVEASPSDGLVSYPGYSLWKGSLIPLQRWSQCIL